MKFLLLIIAAASTVLLPTTATLGQIPVRRATPAVKGPISVESTIIKAGDIPGILYGTNPGFRYFFAVKNAGPKTLSGKVEITLLRGTATPGTADKTFELTIPPGQAQAVSIDSQTGPAIGNSGLITGFSFVALSIIAEGSGSMATNYDKLYSGER